MLHAMIVDDERITREGLRNALDWAAYDITICIEARNGVEALQQILHQQIDILITDVKMPLMDGIELAKRMRELNRGIRIVFISGYSELEYLQSAIRVNVVDYILKPVDLAELEAVIARIARDCREERENLHHNLEIEQKLRESMPQLRERFLLRLMRGSTQPVEAVAQQFAFYEIDWSIDTRVVVFALAIDNYPRTGAQLPHGEWQRVSLGLQSIMQQVIDEHAQGFALEDAEDRFVALIKLSRREEEDEQLVDALSNQLHAKANRYAEGMSLTLGVGLWVDSVALAGESYQRALNALGRRILLGNGRIIYVDELTMPLERSHETQQDVNTFGQAVRAGDAEGAMALARRVFETLSRGEADRVHIQTECMKLLLALLPLRYELDLPKSIVFEPAINAILHMRALSETQDVLLALCSDICDFLRSTRNSYKQQVVSDIKRIIDKRYMDDLTIRELAGEVFLTPAYICMLVKQETGETINQYLTKVRIKRACELLASQKYKLYEVVQMVGYTDAKYFSRLFKQHMGVNPSEYAGG